MLWYTFSLKKEDLARYTESQDLFTTMVLTHGLPLGMTLWIKSKFAAEENMFFAQIPETLNITEEPFFRAFPSTKCDSPSRAGLSLLIGNTTS
ncbi:MAG: hypothetical protein HXX11_13115 [Desulfuromonadales bacterium]|nr:hypothetical protein [Desulfuromonadales bacterium]